MRNGDHRGGQGISFTVSLMMLVLTLLSGLLIPGCGKEEEQVLPEAGDFSVFFGDAVDPIQINELIRLYERQMNLRVDPILTGKNENKERALDRALDAARPVAAYVTAAELDPDVLEDRVDSRRMVSLSALDPKEQGMSIPWRHRGRGLVMDRRLIVEQVGEGSAEQFLEGLRAADYDGWLQFLLALNTVVSDGTPSAAAIQGKTWKLTPDKGPLTRAMNGVFALSGVGDDDGQEGGPALILRQALITTDLAEWKQAPYLTTPEAIAMIQPGLSAFMTGLENMTDMLAGAFSAGIRGEDFVNPEIYGPNDARNIFMAGKAAFLIADSDEFSRLRELDAEKAENLVFMPFKMPYGKYGLAEQIGTGSAVNRSIACAVESAVYFNGTVSTDMREKAYDFIRWLVDEMKISETPLSRSARDYYARGDVYSPAFPEPDPVTEQGRNIFGRNKLDIWLADSRWATADREALSQFLFSVWGRG